MGLARGHRPRSFSAEPACQNWGRRDPSLLRDTHCTGCSLCAEHLQGRLLHIHTTEALAGEHSLEKGSWLLTWISR